MSLDEQDKQWIGERLDASEARMREHMRDIETALLTEFQKWASPNEVKQRRYSAELNEFDRRLEYLEDRIKKLEGRQ